MTDKYWEKYKSKKLSKNPSVKYGTPVAENIPNFQNQEQTDFGEENSEMIHTDYIANLESIILKNHQKQFSTEENLTKQMNSYSKQIEYLQEQLTNMQKKIYHVKCPLEDKIEQIQQSGERMNKRIAFLEKHQENLQKFSDVQKEMVQVHSRISQQEYAHSDLVKDLQNQKKFVSQKITQFEEKVNSDLQQINAKNLKKVEYGEQQIALEIKALKNQIIQSSAQQHDEIIRFNSELQLLSNQLKKIKDFDPQGIQEQENYESRIRSLERTLQTQNTKDVEINYLKDTLHSIQKQLNSNQFAHNTKEGKQYDSIIQQVLSQTQGQQQQIENKLKNLEAQIKQQQSLAFSNIKQESGRSQDQTLQNQMNQIRGELIEWKNNQNENIEKSLNSFTSVIQKLSDHIVKLESKQQVQAQVIQQLNQTIQTQNSMINFQSHQTQVSNMNELLNSMSPQNINESQNQRNEMLQQAMQQTSSKSQGLMLSPSVFSSYRSQNDTLSKFQYIEDAKESMSSPKTDFIYVQNSKELPPKTKKKTRKMKKSKSIAPTVNTSKFSQKEKPKTPKQKSKSKIKIFEDKKPKSQKKEKLEKLYSQLKQTQF